jgi:hypothetical protein
MTSGTNVGFVGFLSNDELKNFDRQREENQFVSGFSQSTTKSDIKPDTIDRHRELKEQPRAERIELYRCERWDPYVAGQALADTLHRVEALSCTAAVPERLRIAELAALFEPRFRSLAEQQNPELLCRCLLDF